MVKPEIKQACTPAEIAGVKRLFALYLAVLETEFDNAVGCAQGQQDLEDFPNGYLALFLGTLEETPYAACGLKHINDEDCELGKLYCQPEGRGHALGIKLTKAVIVHARNLGYKRLVLSTEPVMEHAVKLYTGLGFQPIDKYMQTQSACSRFMGLGL
ncbi:MAG: hypothetical protein COA69_09870 [Robiginitomaculum sp.]|nr:MAG: hypothetical protein COA69_09870 [Robiginitomaculum sp.]